MKGWKKVRLRDVCTIFDGPHATPRKTEHGVVFLGISSINYDGRIDPKYFEFIDEDTYQQWTRRVTPRENDIVFSYETKLGTAAIIPPKFKCCLGRRMGLLRNNDKILPMFLLYSYLSKHFQDQIIENTNTGSTVDRIALLDMPDFTIMLPDMVTQLSIVKTIQPINYKIDLLHRQNATLEAMAEALFRQWFVVEAKEEWEEQRLADLFVIHIGRTPPRKEKECFSYHHGYIWVSIKDMAEEGVFISNSTEYLTKHAIENYSIPIIPASSVLLSFKMTVGRVKIATKDMRSNEAIACFIKKNGSPLSNEFLYLFLRQFKFDELGSTSSIVTAINSSIIKDIAINVPTKDLLCNFDAKVHHLFSKIRFNQQQIRTLEKLRDTLLPKLMSGEVRVDCKGAKPDSFVPNEATLAAMREVESGCAQRVHSVDELFEVLDADD